MNRGNIGRLRFVADCLFYMVPVVAAMYIALVLVPAASERWPARFISWQELLLVMLIIFLAAASFRPLFLLLNERRMVCAGHNGVAAVISLFAILGGTVALLLHFSHWIVGAFLTGAALPPVVRGLAGAGRVEPDRRFNM